jgi:hypothetical protein
MREGSQEDESATSLMLRESLSTGPALGALAAADPDVAALHESLHQKLTKLASGLRPLGSYLQQVHALGGALQKHARDEDAEDDGAGAALT